MSITWRVITIGFAGDRTEAYTGLSWDQANDIRDQIVDNGGRAAIEPEADEDTELAPADSRSPNETHW